MKRLIRSEGFHTPPFRARLLIGGLLLLWSIQALAAQEGTETRALLREIRGTVEIKEPGAADWKPGQRGQTLER
ncbi:MAG: hypothetical protein LBL28_05885, partial [Treponema sp.]|nr:hypothetical protein [Treponema sp.]